jgi:hypothetical protein
MGTFELLPVLILSAGWVSTFTEEDFEEEIKRLAATIRMSAG